MHILVVNDDGPPSNQSSPYVHSLVTTLQAAGHTVSVILPHVQRSWIGKAHIVGQTLTPTYFRPGSLHNDDGITSPRPFNDGKDEWILVDGTPASCVQIGLYHVFNRRGPVDLVLSGPNYGRNTTAVFALSSGTIGGAMEAAVCGKKAIALSYAFDSREHDPEIIATASRLSTKLIEKFVTEWPEDVHLYSVNVPLRKDVESAKIMYTDMLQNKWTQSSFEDLPLDERDADPGQEEHDIREGKPHNHLEANASSRSHMKFKWSPNFADVRASVQAAGHGDGWAVLEGMVSVTPLRANFWHLPQYSGEIKLTDSHRSKRSCYGIIDYPDPYVQPLIVQALQSCEQVSFQMLESTSQLPDASFPVLQCTAYEAIDFEHALEHPTTSLTCAYVIRKALIRKHYLSNTISTWLVKHPESVLGQHFKACEHFEVDYAEFLDEALVDAWDLQQSLARNDEQQDADSREWWILKPGMSDGGNGIRLFSGMSELQAIFDAWDEDDDDDEEEDEAQDDDRVMTSQLRHFIAQPYIDRPLLFASMQRRKFHIRTYALAVGALNVYVYREMLALFAAQPYRHPSQVDQINGLDLTAHLTNTCFQAASTRESSVQRFWALDDPDLSPAWQEKIYDQICEVAGEVFEAAAREQSIHFQVLPNAFEVFGVDFLVDEHLNTWLLELNAYPDFKQTGQGLQDQVVGGLFQEVVSCAVLPFFGLGHGHGGSENMRLVKQIDMGRQ